MNSPIPAPVRAITANPVITRDDMVRLLVDLLSPLSAAQSPGGARIHLIDSGTVFDQGAAELEGYARALWGLAPLLAADPDLPAVAHFRRQWVEGLKNGTNPDHPEYWGDAGPFDQRFVEMAAIGFTLVLAPKVFWEPLSSEERAHVNVWLLQINQGSLPTNNWNFFRVLVNVGLKHVGGEFSQSALDGSLDLVETFYNAEGFPSDGPSESCEAFDYYATSFAIPFYSVIYSVLEGATDPARAKLFRQRALANLPGLIDLFAPDGHNIPFGRSMTYRFATSSLFGALAFGNLELPSGLSWGHIKGLLLRNIRWFTTKPSVFYRDGSLSVGYTSPNIFMSEAYNSPQSPYWALKSFLVLALPKDHPFWLAKEESYPEDRLRKPYTIMRSWMQVLSHAGGHTFALSSGQRVGFPMRHAAAKYGKMAYSSTFAFSIPGGTLGIDQFAPDSTLSISDDPDGERWLARRVVLNASIDNGGVIRSEWHPWEDVSIRTWLVPPSTPDSTFHTRIHKITNHSTKHLTAADASFANETEAVRNANSIKKSDTQHSASETAAFTVSSAGVSGVVDLLGDGRAEVRSADANTNLVFTRTLIPMIMTQVKPGEDKWIATRIYGKPSGSSTKAVDESWLTEWEGQEHSAENKFSDVAALKAAFPFLA